MGSGVWESGLMKHRSLIGWLSHQIFALYVPRDGALFFNIYRANDRRTVANFSLNLLQIYLGKQIDYMSNAH